VALYHDPYAQSNQHTSAGHQQLALDIKEEDEILLK
jgi:hypothetical protein